MSITAATEPADMWYVDYDKALSLGLIKEIEHPPAELDRCLLTGTKCPD